MGRFMHGPAAPGRHELSRRQPELRVLILSMHDNEQYFFEALKSGAWGYARGSCSRRAS